MPSAPPRRAEEASGKKPPSQVRTQTSLAPPFVASSGVRGGGGAGFCPEQPVDEICGRKRVLFAPTGRVEAGDELRASAIGGAALLRLHGGEVLAHALDLRLEVAALGGRGAAEEQKLAGVAADGLRIILCALKLILLAARGVCEACGRVGVAGTHAGDLRLQARAFEPLREGARKARQQGEARSSQTKAALPQRNGHEIPVRHAPPLHHERGVESKPLLSRSASWRQ